ncbi:MAG: FkbM family methyltransferase [Ruminococcaceae bacterium]|nr:FkbM family methyltransferase [Oscillospiraceae bacterium]
MYKSFWYTLSDKNKPVFIYGTGNGADKIIDILGHIGVKISGIFASDGFVRSRTFRDFPVRSYSSVREEFGDDMIILAAFGTTLPDVIDFLRLLDERHELYIPEVPLFCDDLISELFTDEYYTKHRAKLHEVRSILADEESLLLFDEMVAHRLTGKMKFLMRTESPSESLRSVFDTGSIHSAIDGGAFKGDTAELFCDVFPNLDGLVAVEPDPRSHKKLSIMAESHGDSKIIPLCAMLDECSGERVFVSSGSRGSAPDAAIPGSPKRAKEIHTTAISIDDIVREHLDGKIDFLKLDTEGFEMAALYSATETLKRHPALSVSLYHRTGDIFELPLYIRKFYPNGKYYLRRPMCIPEWDLTLYVTE